MDEAGNCGRSNQNAPEQLKDALVEFPRLFQWADQKHQDIMSWGNYFLVPHLEFALFLKV